MPPLIPFVPLIAAGLSAGGAITAGALAAKAGSRKSMTGGPSPLAGASTQLSPGDKINAINTSPQGVLSTPNTGRGTLLGG